MTALEASHEDFFVKNLVVVVGVVVCIPEEGIAALAEVEWRTTVLGAAEVAGFEGVEEAVDNGDDEDDEGDVDDDENDDDDTGFPAKSGAMSGNKSTILTSSGSQLEIPRSSVILVSR